MIVAESDADVALLEKRQALQEKWGLASRLLSAAKVRRIAPYLADSVIASVTFPMKVMRTLVAPAFARRAEALGASIQSQHASQRLTLEQVAAGNVLVGGGEQVAAGNVLVGGGWPSRFSSEGSAMTTHRHAEPSWRT